MRNTRMGLSEIAAALRYADLPCFSRAFRKWSGMSPSDWRLGSKAAARPDAARWRRTIAGTALGTIAGLPRNCGAEELRIRSR